LSSSSNNKTALMPIPFRKRATPLRIALQQIIYPIVIVIRKEI